MREYARQLIGKARVLVDSRLFSSEMVFLNKAKGGGN